MGGKDQAAAAASGGMRVRTARAGQQCRQGVLAVRVPHDEDGVLDFGVLGYPPQLSRAHWISRTSPFPPAKRLLLLSAN